jgi:hypothetical protein
MCSLASPNVLVTADQGFFTHDALVNIAPTTIENLTALRARAGALHRVPLP